MLLLANKCNQCLSPCAHTYNLSWLLCKIQNKTLKTIRKFMTACKFPYLLSVKFKLQWRSIFWKYISNLVNNERINTLHRPICLQETQILDAVMLKFLLIEGKHLSRYYITMAITPTISDCIWKANVHYYIGVFVQNSSCVSWRLTLRCTVKTERIFIHDSSIIHRIIWPEIVTKQESKIPTAIIRIGNPRHTTRQAAETVWCRHADAQF